MRTWILVVMLAVAACGKDKAAGGPPVVPGEPAGDVLEVVGIVTAKRGDEMMRQLNVGDVVSGDDVIGTAAEASVVIQLRHNGVRWSLKGGFDKRLGDSAAWKATSKGDSTAGLGERATAAGRHAEREAAETGASAEKAAAPAAAMRQAVPAVETAPVPSPGAPAPTPAPEHFSFETDLGSEGGLSTDDAMTVVSLNSVSLKACFTSDREVSVTIKIAADGKVANVEVSPDDACVLEVLRGLTFPARDAPSKVEATFKRGE